jgi:hypothetical protein
MKSLTLQQKDASNLADGTGNHIVYSAENQDSQVTLKIKVCD